MAGKRKTEAPQKPIEQYEHKDKVRLNNPPIGLMDAQTDNSSSKKKTYQHDPHLEPQLQWSVKDDIAMWMLDTDYGGHSLFPSSVFFPMAGDKEGWATLARNLNAEIDEEKTEAFRGTVSLPFTPGKAVE